MAFALPKNKSIKQEECTDSEWEGSFPASSTEQRARFRKARKEGAKTWTIETSAPFDDGYQWRKYGTKEIRSSTYPRTYFRCTYRDDRNCAATKQVQQKDFTDPPVYEVIYKDMHTCNSIPISDVKLPIQSASSCMNKPNLISFNFSKGAMHSDQHFADVDVKPCQNQFSSNQDAHFQFHDTNHEFTPVGSGNFNSHGTEAMYCGSSADRWPLQGLDEFGVFDDCALREYLNSSDMNSCG